MVIEPFCLLKGMFGPLDDVVLKDFIDSGEKDAKSGNTHHKARVIIRMCLCIFEDLRPDDIELDVLASQSEIGLDE